MVEQRMGLEQRQKLLFVPLMQQSVKILQLPLLALQQQIEVELQENPLLERDEEEEEVIQENEPEVIEEDSEVDWNSYLEGMEGLYGEKGASPGGEPFNYENIVSQHISLHEYLLNQLHILSLSSKEIALGGGHHRRHR